MTNEQASALRLVAFFWGCIEAGRELDGDPRIEDDAPVMHYCAHGTTAIVTAGHIRELCKLSSQTEKTRQENAS